MLTDRHDWEWLDMHPDYHAIMEPSIDDAFELVLRNTGDPEIDEKMRGNFWNAPDVAEWRTKDLFLVLIA